MFARGPCDEGLRPIRASPAMEHDMLLLGDVPVDTGLETQDDSANADEMCLLDEIVADNIRAQHLYEQGQLGDALDVLESCYQMALPAVDAAQTVPLRRELVALLRNLAHVHFARGQHESSLQYSMEALRVLQPQQQQQEREGMDDDGFDEDLEDEAEEDSDAKDELLASLWCNIGHLLWLLQKGLAEAESALGRALELLTALRQRRRKSENGNNSNAAWNPSLAMPSPLDRDIVSAQTLLLLVQHRQHKGTTTTTASCPSQQQQQQHQQQQQQQRHNDELTSLLQLLLSQRHQLGFLHKAVAETLGALGTVLLRMQRPGEALWFLLEARRVHECNPTAASTSLTPDPFLVTLTQLGQALQGLGHMSEAMSCFREALNRKGQNILDESPQTQALFATVLYNIGMIQSKNHNSTTNGDPQRRVRALHSFRLCLDLRRRALDPHHPSVASVLHNMAVLCLEDRRVAESLEFFQESLAIRRQSAGPREVASSLRHMGRLHQDRGDYTAALRLQQEALSLLLPASASIAPSESVSSRADLQQLIEVFMGLGHAHQSLGHPETALQQFRHAGDLLRRQMSLTTTTTSSSSTASSSTHQAQHQLIKVLHLLGNLSLDMTDLSAAERYFAEASKLSGHPVRRQQESFPFHAAAA